MNAADTAAPSSPRLTVLLKGLYPSQIADATARRLEDVLAKHREELASSRLAPTLSERDVLLIACADHVQAAGESPLRTLARFCEQRLSPLIRGGHLLPFIPGPPTIVSR